MRRGRGTAIRELAHRVGTALTACAAIVLVAGCAGQPGEDAPGGGDTIEAGAGAATDTVGRDDSAAYGDAAAGDTGAAGLARGDTGAADRPPATGDTGSRARTDAATRTEPRPDTAWVRIARGRPDTAVAGRFFVRVLPSADPRTVAERHEVEPIDVVTERVRAFYAELTWGQVKCLARDGVVRSLAQEIEGGDADRPPIRGVPISDSGGR